MLAIGMLFLLAACDKKDDNTPDPTVAFTANLNGASEETPTGSAATGSASASYNQDTKVLTLSLSYTGLTPSAGHIHKGAVGVSGGIVFPFTSLTSPISFTSPPLNAAQEADLMSNLYYVNLHSVAFPLGEIRGQLIKTY